MLLELPPMTRIKLRVSAGVFEVSLVRVVEESSSVEVLWDRGHKREFKWSSVVFGNTGSVVVGQKPAELAVEPERKILNLYTAHRIDHLAQALLLQSLPLPLLPPLPPPLLQLLLLPPLFSHRQAPRSTFL